MYCFPKSITSLFLFMMIQVRQGHGSEGEVFYFVDAEDRVIGLLKKKTAWYVLCRAIREKVRHAVTMHNKEAKTVDTAKISTRLHEIQKWLGFTDQVRDRWIELGSKFQVWTLDKVKSGQEVDVRATFPILWKEFLECEKLSDNFS